MDIPAITLEAQDFITLIPDELYKELDRDCNAKNVITAFCTTVNHFRTGVPVVGYIPPNTFKRMTFFNCRVELESGRSIVMKSHKSHADLLQSKFFTIYLTDEEENKIVWNGRELKWTCVKDKEKNFPKCGTELLKIKFGGHGVKNVTRMLGIFDDYVRHYMATYREHLGEVETA